jgi:hypothetical protein
MTDIHGFQWDDPRRQAPDAAIPRFYRDKNLNNFQSEKAGHPVYDDVEMVEINIAGSSRATSVQIVKAEHKQRWPQAYAAFQAGLEPAHDGAPLEEWPPLSPAQVANLKAMNIHTVEQLSVVSDAATMNIMGGMALREKAAKWLDNAAGGKALSEALAAKTAAEAKLETLQRNYDDLAATVQRLSERVGT